MQKKWQRGIFFILLLLLSFLPLFGDERTENIDVFVVLDKSLSMEEEIEAVKSYVNESIIREVLMPGDFLVLIAFYGQAERLIVQQMNTRADRVQFENEVGSILANGRFTDIGNALDALRSAIDEYRHEERRGYLLLITDGKQEAPPESRYYSEDGSFNHAFLENTRTIQKEGWKIHILGIGTASAAKEIAEELSGTYTEITEEPTKEILEKTTEEFLGRIEVTGTPTLKPVGTSGKSQLSMEVSSVMYESLRNVTIRQISFQGGSVSVDNLLKESFTFQAAPESTVTTIIPVFFPENLEAGEITGTLVFVFQGDTTFSPAYFETSIKVKGFWGNNFFWLIPVIVVVLAGLAVLIIFLLRIEKKSRGVKFRMYLDNKPVHRDPFVLKGDSRGYVVTDKASFGLESEKTPEAVAELSSSEGGLFIKITKPKSFPLLDPLPEGSILGEKFRVKNISGGYFTILFRVV